MHPIEKTIRHFQHRHRLQSIWTGLSTGLLVGGMLGTLLSVLRLALHIPSLWIGTIVAVCGPPIAGLIWGILRAPSVLETARRVDRIAQLKDRLQSAMQFLHLKSRSGAQQLAIEDAEQKLGGLRAEDVAPITVPRTWPSALISAVLAMALMILAVAPASSGATPAANPAVQAQADELQKSLDELKEVQSQSVDPEFDQMLQEMNRQVSLLRDEPLNPREAMATLSEMDAMLRDMQKQLKAASTEASLKEVGEALELAEATSQAGEAMKQGDLKKAADELRKADLPQLDRKTQTAMSEKLDKSQKTAKKSVSEAVRKMAEGMKSKDEKSFSEGKSELADEASREAMRQDLRKQLQKQSQKLAESKGALESAMQVPSSNSKDGNTPAPGNAGKKAGKGTQGNQKGPATESTKGSKELKLKGQDSLAGESDKENEQTTGDESEAMREYRQNPQKYEALSESAIESESIPLGHRQTIRRYFELLRPSASKQEEAAQP